MATLTTQAVISAHDRLTGPLNAMANRVMAVNSRLQRSAQTMYAKSKAMTHAGRGLSGASGTAGFLGFLVGRNEYQYDRSMRFFEATTERSTASMGDFQAKLLNVAQNYRKTRVELMRGAQEAATAGIDRGTITNTLERVAKISIATNEDMGQSYGDLTDVIMSQGMAFSTAEEQIASIDKVANTLAVGTTAANQKWHDFMMGLKQAGPVMKALNIPFEKQLALLGTLADLGLKGEQGGAGLKTLLLRFISPTKKMRDILTARGVRPEDFVNIDKASAFSGDMLSRRLASRGIQLTPALHKAVGDLLSDPTAQTDIDNMRQKLTDMIAGGLGVKPGDIEGRSKLSEVIAAHFSSSLKGFDVEAFISKLRMFNESELGDIAGKHRAPHLFGFVQRLEEVAKKEAKIRSEAPGAIDRRYDKMAIGFAHNIDMLVSGLDVLFGKIMASPFGGWLNNLIGSVTAVVNAVSALPPELLAVAGAATAFTTVAAPSLVVLGLLGMAASKGALNLLMLGGALKRAAIGTAMLAAGPFIKGARALTGYTAATTAANAAMLASPLFSTKAQGRLNTRGAAAASARMIAGMGAQAQASQRMIAGLSMAGLAVQARPAGMLSRLSGAMPMLAKMGRGLAVLTRFTLGGALLSGAIAIGTNFDKISAMFDRLGKTEAMQKLSENWSKLGNALGTVADKIGGRLSDGIRWLFKLFDIDVGSSPIFGALEKLVEILAKVVGFATEAARAVSAVLDGRLPDFMNKDRGSQSRKVQDYSIGNGEFGISEPLTVDQIGTANVRVENPSKDPPTAEAIGAAVGAALAASPLQVNVSGAAGTPAGKASAPAVSKTNGAGYGGK